MAACQHKTQGAAECGRPAHFLWRRFPQDDWQYRCTRHAAGGERVEIRAKEPVR